MKSETEQKPDIRRAVCPIGETGGANSVRHHVEDCGLGQPTIRLAHVDGAQGDGALQGTNGFQIKQEDAPALLISYYYLEPFLKNQARYRYRHWAMDSGAFSAMNSGKKIDLQKYIDQCLKLMESDKTLVEIFALDVIGDPDASLRNCEEMWRQGVPAIPCFHAKEPEEHLLHMAKEYPKIALGGVALTRGDFKLGWLQQCFNRVWPKKIHGFGMAGEEIVFGLPFHSTDATNWEIAPCAFGQWKKFGQMSVRGSNQDLRSQVKYYLELEAKARVRWAKEMAQLEGLPQVAPTIRLVGNGAVDIRAINTFGSPTVRLAADAGAADGKRMEATLAKAPATPPAEVKKKEPPKGELDPRWANWGKQYGGRQIP